MKVGIDMHQVSFFSSYLDIQPAWLVENNIKFILSDLDSTLAKHNTPHNEEEERQFKEWYDSIERVGVGLIIVSNNSQEYVDGFVLKHKLVGIGKCNKPGTKKIQETLVTKGLNLDTVLFIGDQLFTDWWCAKRLDVKFGYISPIPSQEPIHIRVKRLIEKPFFHLAKKKSL